MINFKKLQFQILNYAQKEHNQTSAKGRKRAMEKKSLLSFMYLDYTDWSWRQETGYHYQN